jgi:hypothetical protein
VPLETLGDRGGGLAGVTLGQEGQMTAKRFDQKVSGHRSFLSLRRTDSFDASFISDMREQAL